MVLNKNKVPLRRDFLFFRLQAYQDTFNNFYGTCLLLNKISAMPTVLITGGTGMIGKHLTRMFIAKGYEVIILSRQSMASNPQPGISFAKWDVPNQIIDAEAIAKADYMIHLAGAGVADKRWTNKRKKEIVDSRTQSSTLLVKALREMPNKIKAVVSASAIGWYGADTHESKQYGFTEEAHADAAFLGDTCKQWEESIQPVEALQKRLVKLRTGIVLSNNGGALAEFKKPLQAGVAAILGDGNQIISWIHIDDLCRMFIYAIEQGNMHGAYNAVAPYPVSNKYLVVTLAKEMRGKFFIPVHIPSFVLKMILGEMSIEVLKSATISCNKIKTAGFVFLYPFVDAALKQLVKR